jgi:hypothetical protein
MHRELVGLFALRREKALLLLIHGSSDWMIIWLRRIETKTFEANSVGELSWARFFSRSPVLQDSLVIVRFVNIDLLI